MVPFRFISTPSRLFSSDQKSVLISTSNCAAPFILPKLNQCSSVHWHRYQMQGDFRKLTGSSEATDKDFQQNNNQIGSDVKVLSGTGMQKLHCSYHACSARHSLCPCYDKVREGRRAQPDHLLMPMAPCSVYVKDAPKMACIPLI